MRAAVGVTDDAWAAYLRTRPHLTEANFWLPSPTAGFKALQPGWPYLFKTHHPANELVGGGFYVGFQVLSVAEAWTLFGEGNGVGSLDELARAIARYRKTEPSPDLMIGCVMLRDLFFCDPDEALPGPADFAPNIVRFKGYDIGGGDSPLERQLQTLLDRSTIRLQDELDGTPSLVPGPVFGLPQLVKRRAGQQGFKGLVLASYHRQCAFTGSHLSPTLQAAHIRPVAEEGQNEVRNGLLLRSDVHTLFDAGYLGLNERHELQVSERLWVDFGNGREFYDRQGSVIGLPDRRADRPDKDAVTWHMDVRFLR
jgi:putative restriction endonuclease